jgi:hypothetical protein
MKKTPWPVSLKMSARSRKEVLEQARARYRGRGKEGRSHGGPLRRIDGRRVLLERHSHRYPHAVDREPGGVAR